MIIRPIDKLLFTEWWFIVWYPWMEKVFNRYNACVLNNDIVSIDITITQLTTVSIGLAVVCRFRCSSGSRTVKLSWK